MSDELAFTVRLEQEQDYQFRVIFDLPDVPDLIVDEPSPLGHGAGPNPSRLVAVGVANCLTASLLFCLRKFRQSPGKLTSEVRGTIVRNESGRLRLGGLDVVIRMSEPFEQVGHLDRCIQQFEDFCVVTESIRSGVPVHVKVEDSIGRVLHDTGQPIALLETAAV